LFLVVSTSVIDCLERLVSEMTCYVMSGTLNSTHSLELHKHGHVFDWNVDPRKPHLGSGPVRIGPTPFSDRRSVVKGVPNQGLDCSVS